MRICRKSKVEEGERGETGWRDGVVEVWELFLSLPVRHSKSEADKVILCVVHHLLPTLLCAADWL